MTKKPIILGDSNKLFPKVKYAELITRLKGITFGGQGSGMTMGGLSVEKANRKFRGGK